MSSITHNQLNKVLIVIRFSDCQETSLSRVELLIKRYEQDAYQLAEASAKQGNGGLLGLEVSLGIGNGQGSGGGTGLYGGGSGSGCDIFRRCKQLLYNYLIFSYLGAQNNGLLGLNINLQILPGE